MPNKISKGKRLFRISFRMAALPIAKESALPKWYIYIGEKVFKYILFWKKTVIQKSGFRRLRPWFYRVPVINSLKCYNIRKLSRNNKTLLQCNLRLLLYNLMFWKGNLSWRTEVNILHTEFRYTIICNRKKNKQ